MSFPRAKITRFNDAVSFTPSPADYNVNIKKNAFGAVIPRSDRFADPKSPANVETDSHASAQSAPCFRTPTLPKKKKLFGLSTRKAKPLFMKSKKEEEIFLEEDMLDLEVLKEKMVECNNKDLFIKDLTEHIEEMKMQLCSLEKQKEQVSRERLKYEEQCAELRVEHRVSMENAFLEYDRESNALKEQIKQLENQLLHESLHVQNLQEDLRKLESELQEQKNENGNTLKSLTETEDLLKTQENLLKNKERDLESLQKLMEELKDSQTKQLEKLSKKHNDEVIELEYTMLKSVSDMQTTLERDQATFERKLTALKKECQIEKDKILEESNDRIKQIEENCKETNLLAEMQMQEKYKDLEITWKLKLEEQENQSNEILKECQQISEYSIAQCEWEKNKLKMDLESRLNELKSCQRENADLNIGLNELKMQFDDLNKDLVHLKAYYKGQTEKCKKQIADLQHQKKLYEISIKKAHDTIETLKKRLLNSDRDVEQLTKELDSCELAKLELEGRCNQFRDELKLVVDQNKDLEQQYEQVLNQVNTMEEKLLRRLEEYKTEACKNETNLKEKLRQKEDDLAMLMHTYQQEHMVNTEAANLIEMAEHEIHETSIENEDLKSKLTNALDDIIDSKLRLEDSEAVLTCLQVENRSLRERLDHKQNSIETRAEDLVKQLQQLQEKCESYSKYCDYYKVKASEYEMELEEMETINKKYIEKSGKYDELMQMYELLESKYIALEKKSTDQEVLIGPYRAQLEALSEDKNVAETEDMDKKCVELLGSQNQRLKIIHMIDLKKKNHDLQQAKKDLEIKLKSQGKTIEKLSKQVAQMQIQSPRKAKLQTNTGKENISSPNRTLNNSLVESPGPLRERN